MKVTFEPLDGSVIGTHSVCVSECKQASKGVPKKVGYAHKVIGTPFQLIRQNGLSKVELMQVVKEVEAWQGADNE